MNLILIVAILTISAMPAYAEGQQPSAVQLKEDAKNVVKIISADKLKIESYCKFADLSDQIDEAVQQQDTKKAKELSQRAGELQGNPEFTALTDSLQDMNLNTQDAREMGSIIGKLDEFCGD